MRAPDCTKGGRLAVTMTAATFLARALAAFGGDAEIFQHGADRLLGERRVAQAVARALQADDQAVADELVVARALQLGDVLDARGDLAGRQRARPGRTPGTCGCVVAGSYSAIVEGAAILAGEIALGLRRQAVGQRRLQAEHGREQKGKSAHHDAPTRIGAVGHDGAGEDLAAVDVAHLDEVAGSARLQRHGGGRDGQRAGDEAAPAPARPARPARPRGRG